MVDVSDLGSEFWQFESASGYCKFYQKVMFYVRPLGEMVRHGGLKSHFLNEVPVRVWQWVEKAGGYSLMVKY
jgi:hypothetical protein